MNKKVAKMWVEALRSKKYKKTTGALKVVKDGKARFSVMGVLFDLYQKSHKKKLKEIRAKRLEAVRKGWRVVSVDGFWDNGCRGGIWNRPALSQKVMKWAGIKDGRCEFTVNDKSAPMFIHYDIPIFQVGEVVWLPFLNDMMIWWSFKKFADLIEIHQDEL